MQHQVSANDIRVNLLPTVPNSGAVSCQSSNSKKFKSIENAVLLDQRQASEKLHYLVAVFRSGESEQERKMVEPFRCINPLQLLSNFLTLHPDPNNESSNIVYFIPPLDATLGKENSTLVVKYPLIGSKEYGHGSSAVLNTGGGKIIIQQICELNDTSKTDVTILSTENNFPINDETFIESLKRELEEDYHLTLSVEKCHSGSVVETSSKPSPRNGGYGIHARKWIYVAIIFVLTFTTHFVIV
ncbi:hypothetical protein Ocin01_08484 [Orchesella cincta]|uniref:Uncharacterized protein n=1 Tax=Orchesella cincta TaxID=48709 RepID=A0A1D2MZ20_ORCCI|nr:hypothetical protein Ocin01_08484 [Orchesella cincta]